MKNASTRALLAAMLLAAAAAHAAQVVIPVAGRITLPSGMLVLSCSNLVVQGSLDAGASMLGTAGNVTVTGAFYAGSSTLTLGGNWANTGAFIAGTGTVAFVDGCSSAPAQISGTTPFANLTFQSGSGRAFVIPPAGAISVSGLLTLTGTGAPIQLVSADPTQATSIVLGPEGMVSNTNATLGANFTLDGTAIPRLVNISTRMQVQTGDNVLIAGLIIQGTGTKDVVVRARGPSMAAAQVPNTLANPVLQLFAGSTQLAVNDNWGDAPNAAAIGASGFAPSDPLESAILMRLAPGAYTAIVTGAGGGTGVGIVEVFEVDSQWVPLANISTRGRVLTGDDVMIAGLVIQGSGPQEVVVRARGPSLAAAGVPDVLANPILQLFAGATQLGINDDWQLASNAAQVLSSGFAPSDPREAAILTTLQPGAYTAIVTGVSGTTGVAIVEVFRN